MYHNLTTNVVKTDCQDVCRRQPIHSIRPGSLEFRWSVGIIKIREVVNCGPTTTHSSYVVVGPSEIILNPKTQNPLPLLHLILFCTVNMPTHGINSNPLKDYIIAWFDNGMSSKEIKERLARAGARAVTHSR
jgi:hypothetical protein